MSWLQKRKITSVNPPTYNFLEVDGVLWEGTADAHKLNF